MSDRMQIKATEAGLVRVFAIDLPADRIADLIDPDAPDLCGLKTALGATELSGDHVDLVRLTDLEELGLDGYLIDGLGVAPDDVGPDRTRLRALKGYALVLPSRAFAGIEQTLSPKAPLRWIGTYSEPQVQTHFAPLPSESAKGAPLPRQSKQLSDAAISGRVATVALLVLFALVGLMIWIAS